ncbi:superoxide dismutase family protein [Actinophytocola gossypii]|uniref:Superoxide dismutase family protein n=1 Tax=Actinophytocola gossypii TaxID=2812003 RepID=A0ABT2J4V7_9PSEU|nr:superoxide dismutase family protein [Actinophytocola gossypii]MCT2582893.1 superoxide dismutase family protein [Actinophytocola gossypii]
MSLRPVGTTLVAALVLAGCGAEDSGEEDAPITSADRPSATSASGTLAPPESANGAFTYDPAQAPADATLAVEIVESDESTTVELTVDGMQPDRGYAAHAHTDPCGADGAAAGPHFQHEVDPAATADEPSTDPAYANPDNEIWLDLRTDDTGSGTASTEVPFRFGDREPASVVVHANPTTATGPGEAGKAGDRLACLTIDQR